MAGMCCGINVGENEPTSPVEPAARTASRRRMELRQIKIISDISETNNRIKKRKVEDQEVIDDDDRTQILPVRDCDIVNDNLLTVNEKINQAIVEDFPKFGVTSVCGRRRDMEDAVSICPSFFKNDELKNHGGFHFYGVFDGHGCSHVIILSIIFHHFISSFLL